METSIRHFDQHRPRATPGFLRTSEAACGPASTELFFSPYDDDARIAKEICRKCSVRWECLAYALETGQGHGVWGGLTSEERHALRRKTRQGMKP